MINNSWKDLRWKDIGWFIVHSTLKTLDTELGFQFVQILFLLSTAMTANQTYDFSSVTLADFEIGERIGKGQFSVVYRARCKLNNQLVALKKVQIYEMTDLKARVDCMKEIQLLQVIQFVFPF